LAAPKNDFSDFEIRESHENGMLAESGRPPLNWCVLRPTMR
jgi:hypothetical protein